MSYCDPTVFADWKAKAEAVGLLACAKVFKANLKKSGSEWVGPCPYCGGKDRFAISPAKAKWVCRGSTGGNSVISLAMHIGNISYKEAIEQLSGEPCPAGPARPLSETEQAERNRRRLANEAAQRAREAEQERYLENTRETAAAIWNASRPISGTLAQLYLNKRGIVLDEYPAVLRFHPNLPYPGKSKGYPVLVCRVDDVTGEMCAVWRIYLREDGRKADVEAAKLGLGPAGGGAVRIGGISRKIAILEGVESALGYWLLTSQRYPAWAALSTSGMIGFEVPLGVEHCIIGPDGDRACKRQGHDFIPTIPAGRKAAQALRSRLLTEGITTTIAAEPRPGTDYLDLWLSKQGETTHEARTVSHQASENRL